MVVSYLEKIRDRFMKEKIELSSQLSIFLNEQKENTEIIKVLEMNDDPNFEAFTPRQVNSFNKTKIMELKERQKKLECEIVDYNEKIRMKENEIEEIILVIKTAKEMH